MTDLNFTTLHSAYRTSPFASHACAHSRSRTVYRGPCPPLTTAHARLLPHRCTGFSRTAAHVPYTRFCLPALRAPLLGLRFTTSCCYVTIPHGSYAAIYLLYLPLHLPTTTAAPAVLFTCLRTTTRGFGAFLIRGYLPGPSHHTHSHPFLHHHCARHTSATTACDTAFTQFPGWVSICLIRYPAPGYYTGSRFHGLLPPGFTGSCLAITSPYALVPPWFSPTTHTFTHGSTTFTDTVTHYATTTRVYTFPALPFSLPCSYRYTTAMIPAPPRTYTHLFT